MNDLILAAGETTVQLNGTQLGISVVASVVVLILLVTVAKLHPFVSLLISALVVGIGSGYGPVATVESFSATFGSTMASVGILVGLGAMLGRVLMDTGAADSIVGTLLAKTSMRMIPWTMALIGALIGLPMFFEVGLVVLVPVIILIARRSNLPLMRVAIPTLAGLSVMHACMPPQPGPLAALSNFPDGSVGVTMMFGLPIAVITAALVGPLFSRIAAKWVPVPAPESLGDESAAAAAATAAKPRNRALPPFWLSVLCILVPAILMLGNAIFEIVAPDQAGSSALHAQILAFFGKPAIALVTAVLFSMITLGKVTRMSWKDVNDSLKAALPPIAGILLIVGAGGGYKGVLVDTGIGDIIGRFVESSSVSIFLLAWLIAAFVRVATGSATVAIITTAGILGPVVEQMGVTTPSIALLVIAIGAGSVFLSHVNDAGFWLIKEYFGLKVGETFKTWSVLECLLSVVVLALVMICSVFVPLV